MKLFHQKDLTIAVLGSILSKLSREVHEARIKTGTKENFEKSCEKKFLTGRVKRDTIQSQLRERTSSNEEIQKNLKKFLTSGSESGKI